MGNTSLRPEVFGQLSSAPQEWGKPDPERGVLTWVGAEHITPAHAQLPPASPDERHTPVRKAVSKAVPGLGDVEIVFELKSYKYRRSTNWYWSMVRADVVKAPG